MGGIVLIAGIAFIIICLIRRKNNDDFNTTASGKTQTITSQSEPENMEMVHHNNNDGNINDTMAPINLEIIPNPPETPGNPEYNNQFSSDEGNELTNNNNENNNNNNNNNNDDRGHSIANSDNNVVNDMNITGGNQE